MINLSGVTVNFYKAGLRSAGKSQGSIRIDESGASIVVENIPDDATQMQFVFALAVDGQEALAILYSNVMEVRR